MALREALFSPLFLIKQEKEELSAQRLPSLLRVYPGCNSGVYTLGGVYPGVNRGVYTLSGVYPGVYPGENSGVYPRVYHGENSGVYPRVYHDVYTSRCT